MKRVLESRRFSFSKIRLADDFNALLPQQLPVQVTEFTTGFGYNSPLILPAKVEFVNLGWAFDQPLKLPRTVRRLTITGSYTEPLRLPDSLVEFSVACLDESYRYHPVHLPPDTKKVALYSDSMVTLPVLLESLTWGSSEPMVPLPDSLQELVVDQEDFIHPIEALPASLRILNLLNTHVDCLLQLPAGLQELFTPHEYPHPLNLPERLEKAVLCLSDDYPHNVTLPKKMRELRLDGNIRVELSPALEQASFYCGFDQPLVLPDTVKVVQFDNDEYSHDLVLPPYCCLKYYEKVVYVGGKEQFVATPDWISENCTHWSSE